MRIIDSDRLRNVCKIGTGASSCRYIMSGRSGFQCGKHTDYRAVIDKRVQEGNYTALGDNCPGLVNSAPNWKTGN